MSLLVIIVLLYNGSVVGIMIKVSDKFTKETIGQEVIVASTMIRYAVSSYSRYICLGQLYKL